MYVSIEAIQVVTVPLKGGAGVCGSARCFVDLLFRALSL